MADLTLEALEALRDYENMKFWSCPCCTYTNLGTFSKCYLCGADKQGKGSMSFAEAAERLGTGIRVS